MKVDAIALLAVAGAHVARAMPTTSLVEFSHTSDLHTRSPLQKRDRFCKGMFGGTSRPTGSGVPLVADCNAIVAELRLSGPRSWSLNVDTKERELLVNGTCAISVWNPLEESIDVGEEDLIYIIEGQMPWRGYVRGEGKLMWCHEDEAGNVKELPYKLDFPEEKDLMKNKDLKTNNDAGDLKLK